MAQPQQYDARIQLISEMQNFIASLKARGYPEWLIADTLMAYGAIESGQMGWDVATTQARFVQLMTGYQRR